MPVIEKLLGIATLASSFTRTSTRQRILSGLTDVLAMTIIGALIGSAFLLTVFCGAYFGLVYYGLNPYAAAVTIAVLMLLTSATLFALTAHRLRSLREMTMIAPHHELPGLNWLTGIVTAFLEGLKTPANIPEKRYNK